MSSVLLQTPLYEEHLTAKGKMIPFAGYDLPVHYPTGISAEHHAVRGAAGLFDVSHMGEFEVSGPGALDLIQFLSSNDAAELSVGQAQYSTLPRADGGILDDLLVYRRDDRYLLVVNASNRAKDFDWISSHVSRFSARVTDRSDEIALLALQGPRAAEVLAPLTTVILDRLDYYRFAEGEVGGRSAIVSRTGYTGEDGFELYLDAADAVTIWRLILDTGRDHGVIPAGLGARDSLRLEMGYALYGSDLDESRTPLDAGLGWVTKLGKPAFVAGDALKRQKAAGPHVRLVGFRMLERAFPRPGYPLVQKDRQVGTVTSGILSPSLGYGIGLGYVPVELAKPGTPLDVVVRGQPLLAEVVRPPFYTAGSIRK
jgi:aminomethyltransferase